MTAHHNIRWLHISMSREPLIWSQLTRYHRNVRWPHCIIQTVVWASVSFQRLHPLMSYGQRLTVTCGGYSPCRTVTGLPDSREVHFSVKSQASPLYPIVASPYPIVAYSYLCSESHLPSLALELLNVTYDGVTVSCGGLNQLSPESSADLSSLTRTHRIPQWGHCILRWLRENWLPDLILMDLANSHLLHLGLQLELCFQGFVIWP